MALHDFSWHPDRRGRYAFLCVPVVIGVALLVAGRHGTMFRVLGWWFALAPLLGMIESSAMVDPARRTLVRRWRLLGWLPLRTKTEDLASFEAVTRRRTTQGHGFGAEWVVLVRQGGRRYVWICYFRVVDACLCPQAKEQAGRLAEVTGLPLRDYPDRFYSKKAPHSGIGH